LLGVGVVFLEHHLEEVLVGLFLFGLLVLWQSLPIHLHDKLLGVWINNHISKTQVVDGQRCSLESGVHRRHSFCCSKSFLFRSWASKECRLGGGDVDQCNWWHQS
jgi:hypothetical protein